MVKMIPPYFKESFVSNAERKIFKAFEKLRMECTVFHSLSLASHLDKVYGEIDFVIVCAEGILCLEIKGGAVYREDGVWHFQDRLGNINTNTEGPFKQVVGNMYSLQHDIKKNVGLNHPLSRCQYACGVVFPDFAFNRKGPDFIPEIVYDNRYSDEELVDYIKKVFKYWRNITRERHNFEGGHLTKTDIMNAETILRGNFACIPTLGNTIDEIDKRLIELTEEQFNNLRLFRENDRIILQGGAGTGKTLIALEHAKRLATTGKRVLYLCYNKLISSYLQHGIDYENIIYQGSLHITNFHEYLGRHIYMDDLNDFIGNEFFKNIMPERFIEYISMNPMETKFDAIIIDEGQDLLRTNYILCLDEILSGGIQDGNWLLFYDSNQNIYNTDFEEGYKLLKSYRPTLLSLNINCRNTRQIATYNMMLTGLRHEEVMKVQGEHVERIAYENNAELKRKLVKLIKKLKSDGVNVGDITILSPNTFEKSGLEGNNIFQGICKFQNISSMRYHNVIEDSIKFSTIQSFKGLESKIIVLIDINGFDDIRTRLLNYTAISRARVLLYIFYKRDSEQEMEMVIGESIEKLSALSN